MHDPVRPVLKQPAVIGWEAKQRDVELTIQRPFKGNELLGRMKGWVTADVEQAISIIEKHGRLKVIDGEDLVVECETEKDLNALAEALTAAFEAEAWIEVIPKKRLE
jgi:hypothetical protein